WPLRDRLLGFGPFAPGRYKANIGPLGLRDELSLGVSQGLDIVILRSPRSVAAALQRHSGLDLHLPQLSLMERRASEGIILALGQQVPDENRDFARGSNRGDLLSASDFDTNEKGVERPRRGCRSPGRLDQKTPRQEPALLGDAAVMGGSVA